MISMHDTDVVPQTAPAKIAADHNSIGEFLSEYGIKPTRQRVAIATHMFEKEQHLSADVILERVNKDATTSTVSKATVYNTLKLFVKEGILKEVALDPQRIIFDTNTHKHHHVLNVETGEIRDITPLCIDVSDVDGINSNENVAGIDLIIKVLKD